MATQTKQAIDEARGLLEGRLRELDSERAKVERAIEALRDRAPRRRSGAGETKTPRRPRSGGTRAEQALKVVKRQPGLRASEIAGKIGVAPNYVYRVMADLQKQGKVRKDGRVFHAANQKRSAKAKS